MISYSIHATETEGQLIATKSVTTTRLKFADFIANQFRSEGFIVETEIIKIK